MTEITFEHPFYGKTKTTVDDALKERIEAVLLDKVGFITKEKRI